MSLINEALQRARDEATRREAARKGLPLAPSLRSRQRSPIIMLIVFVLATALTITLLVLAQTAGSLFSRPSSDTTRVSTEIDAGMTTPASGPTEAEHTAFATDAPPGEQVARSGDGVKLPTGVGSSSESVPSRAAGTAAAEPPGSDSSGSEKPLQDASSVSAPASKAEVGTRADPSAVAPRVFVSLATLADGSSIDLGGIAWSETGPYALLNGKVVGIGESIEGYLVTEITPTQVSFEKFGERIVLRLK